MNLYNSPNSSCQLDFEEQYNVQCPFKPKIPYTVQNTFVQEIGQASYLSRQPSEHLKHNMVGQNIANNSEYSCCDKFEQISQKYESSLQAQIITMLQLNELIDEHSILLETYLQKQRIHIDKQKLPIICQEQQNSDSQWKQKWEQENRLNHQRNQKINELKKKLEGLEEQCVQTESFQITLELDSWRNKYQNLTKIHNETAEKLKVLEIELEQLKQSQPVEDSDQSKRTSVISTRRRQTKQIEL